MSDTEVREYPLNRNVVYTLHENRLSVSFRVVDTHHVVTSTGRKTFETSEIGEFTDDINEAEWELRGFVKWDGCTHWATPADAMLHLCRKDDVVAFGELMGAVFEDCMDIMRKAGVSTL